MNIIEAEQNLKKITTKFSKETFIFDLMTAYDFPKSTISKLKIKNKNHDDVVVPSKLHFVGVPKKELDSKFNELVKDYATVKKAPRFIIVTDYQSLKAYDTKAAEKLDTEIKNLSKHPDFFLPWAGIEKKVFQGENPADVKAAEKLAKFFDLILKDNLKLVEKERHALNVFLTRILFCFFAEDTDIFKKGLFTESLASHTKADGSDLDDYLQRLFDLLNKKSRSGLPDYLKEFPYVNGGLFAEEFPIPTFSKKSRESLIDLGSDLNWAEINPDIFGSMIQAVVHPDQRAGLGMHYTSVTNIMKVIEPLFLIELKEEFSSSKGNKSKLKKLLERVSKIKIFDPACGSGNFLIIAYKELRLLEMDILKALGEIPMSGITLSNFYGIEIDDFAHEVAKLSLWLAEHQMNVLFNKQFGDVKVSLPLKNSGKVVCGNATQIEWEKVCDNSDRNQEVYLLGNPPYLGATYQSKEQKKDLDLVFKDFKQYKKLDYIACWIWKACKYIKGKNCTFAFVSTNSICQGTLVSMLWPKIFQEKLEIGFGHSSFKWVNNAKNKAGVTCIIIGVRNQSGKPKFLFDNGIRKQVKNINAYLVSGENIIVSPSSKPLNTLPSMSNGNKAVDGGHLILSVAEKNELVKKYPEANKFFKKLIGSKELLDGSIRYCIWITEPNLKEALKILPIKEIVEQVKKVRLESDDDGAKDLASIPYRFRDQRMCKGHFLLIPSVSSERRIYIPTGIFDTSYVPVAPNFAIMDAETYLFGVVSSYLHILWVKAVSGQLESRVRYSSSLCYNTFPIPDLTNEQKEKIQIASNNILSIRAKFSGHKIEKLYDPDEMPEELLKAHQALDVEVERCFDKRGFSNDSERLEFLFNRYKTLAEKK